MATSRLGASAFGVLWAGIGSGACDVELPACPGQCFAYTVEYEIPKECNTAIFDGIDIPFTGSAPDGYRGRVCISSSSVALAVQAIEHLEAGGQLSDLGVEVQSAYVATVEAVRADVQAECNTAAPGQCANEAQVCAGIGADMYEQLVIEETCVLALDGVEPVALGPGEACEFVPAEPATTSAEAGDHCTEVTTGTGGTGADETSGGAGASQDRVRRRR